MNSREVRENVRRWPGRQGRGVYVSKFLSELQFCLENLAGKESFKFCRRAETKAKISFQEDLNAM
jgi:hypothetical protein